VPTVVVLNITGSGRTCVTTGDAVVVDDVAVSVDADVVVALVPAVVVVSVTGVGTDATGHGGKVGAPIGAHGDEGASIDDVAVVVVTVVVVVVVVVVIVVVVVVVGVLVVTGQGGKVGAP